MSPPRYAGPQCPNPAQAVEENERSPFAEFALELWAIQRQMIRGCGNHGCRIKKPVGMATNGPCHCTARYFARDLLDIACRIEKL